MEGTPPMSSNEDETGVKLIIIIIIISCRKNLIQLHPSAESTNMVAI